MPSKKVSTFTESASCTHGGHLASTTARANDNALIKGRTNNDAMGPSISDLLYIGPGEPKLAS